MQMAEQHILNFVRFVELNGWSANSMHFKKIKSSYPLVPLSKVLKRIKEPIVVEDEKLYKRITVRLYGQGILKRDELYGKDIGTKRQFIAREGQLIISRIDARNGAFGIVPKELDGAVVTNDFWLFDVQNALPQYILLILTSERFQQYWHTKSSGTTNRQRIDENGFLMSKIPLPSIDIQKELLEKYNIGIGIAKKCKEEIAALEKEIESYWLDCLGVSILSTPSPDDKMLHAVKFASLYRWDVWTESSKYSLSKYKFSKLSSVVIGKPLYGANEKAVKVKSDVRYIRITDINEDGTLNDDVVSVNKVAEKYLLEDNDFLIARSGNTVGKTFLYKKSFGKCIFAGYLVRYKLNTQKIVPEYLLYYTKSALFKSWIQNNQRIFGQPNINGQEYLSADIIIPELELQQEIVEYIGNLRHEIISKKSDANAAIALTKKRFEEAVFSET